MTKTPLGAALGLLCLMVPLVQAQTAELWDPQGLVMERVDLEDLLGRLEGVAGSSAYSGRIREGARRDMDLIRARLEEGDFRLGDQIRLTLEGEADIPEVLPVEPGPRITIPTIGAISLRGVLRSELEDHLTHELSRYIQQPVVRATSEIRVSIQGAVGAPGFYTAPATMLIGEALMLAGGPGPTSNLEDIRVDRAGEVLWEGEEVSQFLAEGRTLDQMNLRGGDQITMPVDSGSFWSSGWGSVARWGLAITSTVVFGVRVFGGGF